MRTDAELIRQARRDPDALGELYVRHAASIHRWLISRTSPHIAAELTAETFAQAALSLRRFRDPGDGSAGPWVFGIARNLLNRFYEHERVEHRARQRLGMQISAPGPDVADGLDERDRAERLQPALAGALASLPRGQRRALELRVVEQLPYEEIAASLACSEGAARIRVTRALASLANRLKGVAT